jgi:hypothetical protein
VIHLSDNIEASTHTRGFLLRRFDSFPERILIGGVKGGLAGKWRKKAKGGGG